MGKMHGLGLAYKWSIRRVMKMETSTKRSITVMTIQAVRYQGDPTNIRQVHVDSPIAVIPTPVLILQTLGRIAYVPLQTQTEIRIEVSLAAPAN
jgi:hypothetical protein